MSLRWKCSHKAPVAQLDRALDFESRGREFESLRARQRHLRGEAALAAATAINLRSSPAPGGRGWRLTCGEPD